MDDISHNVTAAAAGHEREVDVDKRAAELVARLIAEAETNGIEAASRAADAAILGAVRFMATRDGGHTRTAEFCGHLCAEAQRLMALEKATKVPAVLN